MYRKTGLVCFVAAVGLAAPTGCGAALFPTAGSPSTSQSIAATSAESSASASVPSSSSGTSAAFDLKTASTSLGTVVVDGKGMTIYFFDKDTPNTGKSPCSADCLAAWPAVSAASAIDPVDMVAQVRVPGVNVGYHVGGLPEIVLFAVVRSGEHVAEKDTGYLRELGLDVGERGRVSGHGPGNAAIGDYDTEGRGLVHVGQSRPIWRCDVPVGPGAPEGVVSRQVVAARCPFV